MQILEFILTLLFCFLSVYNMLTANREELKNRGKISTKLFTSMLLFVLALILLTKLYDSWAGIIYILIIITEALAIGINLKGRPNKLELFLISKFNDYIIVVLWIFILIHKFEKIMIYLK